MLFLAQKLFLFQFRISFSLKNASDSNLGHSAKLGSAKLIFDTVKLGQE